MVTAPYAVNNMEHNSRPWFSLDTDVVNLEPGCLVYRDRCSCRPGHMLCVLSIDDCHPVAPL